VLAGAQYARRLLLPILPRRVRHRRVVDQRERALARDRVSSAG
jgi:hypothetical protein